MDTFNNLRGVYLLFLVYFCWSGKSKPLTSSSPETIKSTLSRLCPDKPRSAAANKLANLSERNGTQDFFILMVVITCMQTLSPPMNQTSSSLIILPHKP